MDSSSSKQAYTPVYAVVALYGLVTGSVMALIKGSSQAAAMPAMTAAGLVWRTKELLTKDKGTEEAPSLLSETTSILNWHDMPIAQH